jgi:hypothetical protein
MKPLIDILTGKDGQTHDIGRWSWVGSMLAVIAAALHTAWTKGTVDLVAFGQAIATVVGAHGAALWAKKDTEPVKGDPPTQ